MVYNLVIKCPLPLRKRKMKKNLAYQVPGELFFKTDFFKAILILEHL